jgi:hypothetical protein
MKSTRITKHNKLRKNSKLKKRFIRGGSKKGNKKHVKRSIEKKSRKIGGSSDTNGEVETGRVKALIKHFQRGPHHNNGSVLLNSESIPYGGNYNNRRNRNREPSSGYDVLRPIRPGANETYNTPSNLQLLKRIVKQIDIDKQTPINKKKINDALARANSLSPDELENLKAELEQLIGNQQPLNAEPNEATERLYETVGPPSALPLESQSASPPPPPPRNRCNSRKASACEQSGDDCVLETIFTRKFGIFHIKNQVCRKRTSALAPRFKPNKNKQNTSGSNYLEPNNLSGARK